MYDGSRPIASLEIDLQIVIPREELGLLPFAMVVSVVIRICYFGLLKAFVIVF